LIPEKTLRHLPPPPPPPKPPELATLKVERVLESSARAFQREIYLYWSFIHKEAVPLIGRGLLLKKVLIALNETLLQREEIGTGKKESDFPRLLFLRALTNRLGLLMETRDGYLRAVENPAYLGLPPVERLQRSYDLYVNGRLINELAWYPNLKLSSMGAPRLPTPDIVSDARRVLLLHLKRAVQWTRLSDLLDLIQEVDYEFLFSRSYTSPVYSYYYNYGSHPYVQYGNPLGWEFTGVQNEADGWMQVEGRFIRDVISKPLFWMGLVDLGYSGPGQREPDAFRLTPIGAWLLGVGPQPEIPVEGGQVIVQPNFHIMAFDPVSDAVLVNLSRFAERVSTERVSEYRLTRLSVYNAQKAGWGVEQIRAYLETLTGTSLPGNVRRTMEEWQTLHERIRIYPKLKVIHAASSEELDHLFTDPELRQSFGRRLEPRLAEIRSGQTLAGVARLLFRREQLPLVHTGGRRPPPRSVTLIEEPHRMWLQFNVPTPDLYLHGHLARFANAEEGGYRLTAESLRRAKAGGLEAPQVLQALGEVLDAPVSESAARRIRAWSGHYGSAALEETILLELESEAVLKELLEDAELGPLLRAFRPRDTQALARVRPKDLDRLRILLEERGIDLRSKSR
jgi:hypothetical protein